MTAAKATPARPLAALRRGEAHPEAVLLLHGFMGRGRDWLPVIEPLAARWCCLAPDLPGHGASLGRVDADYSMAGAAQALCRLLEAAGRDQAVVVGYSMGGRLALYFALHHGERCAGLVLESASPGLATAQARAARRQADAARAEALQADPAAFLDAWYRQPLFASLQAHPGLVRQLAADRLDNDPAELARALRGMGTGQQPSLWERLGALGVATLALAGALDTKYARLAADMARRSPRLQAHIVSGAGHNIHLERPAAYLHLLTQYLNQDRSPWKPK